ncbi:MAG: hypothetical protein PVI23_11130 [Maricaulaceae bacterium]|jgi:hypothetical protein
MIQHQEARRFGVVRKFSVAALAATAFLSVGCASEGGVFQLAARDQASQPIEEGQHYVMATHSFNVFIGPSRRRGQEPGPGPLAALAEEAGKAGHEALAVQMIGGSTPMQHWAQGGDDETQNIAKAALRAGGVDVFTMSPNAIMPEDGIDLFGDFLIETNPEARLMVQNSWNAWDGNGATPAVGGSGGGDFTNADRDDRTIAEIDAWIESLHSDGGYLDRLHGQLEEINDRAGREMAYVVPSADAVYALRKETIRGNVPGIERQSQLFADPIGHPREPVANLVTYVWFAAMYRESPVGLTALVNPDDPTSAARERFLQQLAWNAVINEPMSGVVGEPVMLAAVE